MLISKIVYAVNLI